MTCCRQSPIRPQVAGVACLLIGLVASDLSAQLSRDLSGRTAPPAPKLVTLAPSALRVTPANTVVGLTFTGTNFGMGDVRRRRLLVRERGGRWLQVAGAPASNTHWAVQLTTWPWLQEPRTLEFKAVVDGVESNIYKVEVK